MIPLHSNYTYNVDEFKYIPDHSMAGVFYLDHDTNPAFNYLRPYPGLNLPPPYFFDIPFPFSIRSSSHGLLLCYDLCNSTYHVFNPFINTPASYRRIPTPPREHEFNTPAVLDVNLTYSSAGPLFDIICAVEDEPGVYTFDTYSSNEDTWTTDTEVLTIKPCSIVANTGINTGKGMAIWLTSKPYKLVVYKVPSGWRMFKGPTGLPENATLQIGRTDEDDIAVVASGGLSEVRVLIWQKSLKSWKELGVYVDLVGAVNLMRFVMELPLFTTDRIMRLWSFYDRKIYSMPQWIRVPPNISDCVPYVTSDYVANQFKKLEYSDDDEDDDENEDDEDEDEDDGDEDDDENENEDEDEDEDEDDEDADDKDEDEDDEDEDDEDHGDEDGKDKDEGVGDGDDTDDELDDYIFLRRKGDD